jgi:AcrR family transcriptional regulator
MNAFKTEPAMKDLKAKARKSEDTRKKLVEVSMKLFLQQGFEKTTMREIARAAGLAPGAAYYYFESKEHLIFDFYQKSFDDHQEEAERVLGEEKSLAKRLSGLIQAHLKVSEPYYEISKALFRVAIDPKNPLSPFSLESKELRDKNIALLRRALENQKGIPPEFIEKLPAMLWMLKMAMILYWLHDPSQGHSKTYKLVEVSSDLVARLISVASLPVLREFTKKLVAMFYEFKTFD